MIKYNFAIIFVFLLFIRFFGYCQKPVFLGYDKSDMDSLSWVNPDTMVLADKKFVRIPNKIDGNLRVMFHGDKLFVIDKTGRVQDFVIVGFSSYAEGKLYGQHGRYMEVAVEGAMRKAKKGERFQFDNFTVSDKQRRKYRIAIENLSVKAL